ncbi:enoyl-CoA hydratase/isomerase family protein [Bradyrhizobium sp. RDT10]
MAVLEIEKRNRIAYLRMNRPEAKNAINLELHEALCAAWDDLEKDDSIDVAIITGTGDAFCGGMDLKTHVTQYVNASPGKIADWVKLGLGGTTRGKHRFPKPVIAAVNGWALAGGFETALAADIRIASERAQFGSFEARRGFHHGDGGIARLVNFCGVGIAMEMLLTAEPINAQRALQINLVSKVVPHEKLMETAENVAKTIIRNDQASVRSAKQVVLDMIGRPLDDQLYKEAYASYTLMASNPTVPDLLRKFYEKTDKGRHGLNATKL